MLALSVWSEVRTCIWPSWCHCHSLSLAPVKYRLVLPFWYRLTWVVPDKGPLSGCGCGLTKMKPKENVHPGGVLSASGRLNERAPTSHTRAIVPQCCNDNESLCGRGKFDHPTIYKLLNRSSPKFARVITSRCLPRFQVLSRSDTENVCVEIDTLLIKISLDRAMQKKHSVATAIRSNATITVATCY